MIRTVIDNSIIDTNEEEYNNYSWITNSSCILKLNLAD